MNSEDRTRYDNSAPTPTLIDDMFNKLGCVPTVMILSALGVGAVLGAAYLYILYAWS